MTDRPFTDAEICSRALALVEHAFKIESLDEGTEEANLATLHWDACRRFVLKAAVWNFASKFAQLDAVLSDEITEARFPYAYQLPGDAMRVVRILDVPRQSWRVLDERNILYCRYEAPIRIEYNRDFDEPARFSETFVEALEFQLASRFAPRYARSGNRRMQLLKDYRDLIAEVAEADGFEGGDAFHDDAARHDWRDDFGPCASYHPHYYGGYG